MKHQIFLVPIALSLCGAFTNCNHFQAISNYTSLALATRTATRQVFSMYATSANVVVPENSNPSIGDFTDELCRLFTGNPEAAFRLSSSSKLLNLPTKFRRRFVIIVITSYNDFEDVLKELSPDQFWLNGFYTIVLTNGEIPEIQMIFKRLWMLQIYNCVVLFCNGSSEVLIKTFEPFNDVNCHDTTPLLINRFRNGKFTNDSENIFPLKMRNLHNCPIRVSVSNSSQPAVIATLNSNGSYQLQGSDIKILNAVSKSLNFSINYTHIGYEMIAFENGTTLNVLNSISLDIADMSISDWWLKADRMSKYGFSIPYTTDKFVFVVPGGSNLTAIDKLVRPFDPLVWMLVVAVFFIGFLVIYTVNCNSKHIQDFVFGINIKHPYLNLLIAFVGGTQRKLPSRNFARFLLMMFLMYSLVIRTLYQGSYYKILKSSMQYKEVQSIDEMIAKDFIFYLHPGIADIMITTDTMRLKDR